ncbi:MAG: Gldg family protein, partial [Leptospiraceae bacterium]|nr:Gldg family protein [Leptospiraceae bacterium]
YSIVALIAVLVLANYLTTLRNPVLDFPGTYTFGDQASTLIGSLDRDIEAYVFLPEAQMVKTKPGPGTEPELIRISEDVRLMLEQLPIINSRIKLTFLNADLASFDSTEFGSVSNGTIIFRVRKTQLTGVDEKPYIERRVYVYSERDLGRLEKEATRALIHVASPQIKVCFTNSNGERFGFTHQVNKADGLGELKRELQFFNANIQALDFNTDWPGPISDDCDAVFISGPSVPFGDVAQSAIFDYLKQGGNVLIAIDPTGREHFDWLREQTAGPYYAFVDKPLTNTRLSGLAITQDTVEHRITENISSGGRQSILLIKQGYFQKAANPAVPDGAMPSNGGGQAPVNAPPATDNANNSEDSPGNSAVYRTPADLAPEVFLYSNYESYYDANFNGRLDGAEQTVREPIGIAYAQPENPEGPKIVMYSGVDWLTDRGLSFPVNKANQVLLVDSLMWMTENPLAAALIAEEPESETVQLTDEIKLRLLIFGLVLFPLGITITMIVAVVLYRRRRRFVGEG